MDLKAKGIQGAMARTYKMQISYMKAFRASNFAREGLYGDRISEFQLLDVF